MSSVFILIISTLCFQWICITFTSHFCESKLSLWMEKSFSLVEASIFASHFHVLVNEPLDLDSGIHLGWTVLESSNEDRKGLFTTWTVSTTIYDGSPVDERDSSPSMLHTPINESGMNPIGRGCSFAKYGWTASDCDDREWTPEWRRVFISVGTLFTINHWQNTAFHWIADSVEWIPLDVGIRSCDWMCGIGTGERE